ncbi:uncharacterized protein LOC116262562 [Nymphaea colorata]|uniref:uncharacterized protein LOC116262562 n=1 Tax=Nymphaea colorata TaxID=210225 RepID=UPI00129E5835|nr:uncharacterized protein LOC116262562 [Nymphaea colorata]XP_031497917.1 uncharacterized protein LOC116262562 [Nymphaea colorata]XP_049936658.1 uncharacterized protein LOC116262562 [Nymphaea colorata]XP_049936659.1 uncharacterized protein LOC116262562 [Nymphaea colorata]
MSPQARSKSKEKSSSKATKEQKSPSKVANGNASAGSPANAYNPVSGTFHSLETVAVSPAASPKGRYRSIDETDDHSGSSLGTTADYDSVSNNESCSGESEDLKEKASVAPRQEPPPGSGSSGNEKRDKIRQKNERKHQRQRERRAQELHDRCNGYLMSWKLEALLQQLVAMGFSSDRATMALIMNEGRAEESVAWLFEAGEEVQAAEAKVGAGGNLKIDITEELARMADMEIKFKCTKQEVERAVVACEGDLEKAAELLRTQKQETKSSKPEEPMDLPSSAGTKQVAAVPLSVSKAPSIAKAGAVPLVLQRREERDFNYARMVSDPGNRQVVAGRRSQAKSEWARNQLPPTTDRKSWPSASASASVSYSLATTLSGVPLAPKTSQPDARGLAGGNESKTSSQTVTVREPVIVMQRPQSNNSKQHSATNPGGTSAMVSWKTKSDGGIEHVPSSGPVDTVATSTSTSNAGAQQHKPSQYQPFMPSPVDAIAASWSAATSIAGGYGGSADPQIPAGAGWSAQGHQHLGVSSALGVYAGWSSSGPSGNPFSPSTADWSRGRLMMECDYTNIDWSLTPSSCISRPGQSTPGFSSLSSNSQAYEPWLGTSDSKGVGGLFGSRQREQNSGVAPEGSSALHDWTSPFAGKDLFSLPRQVVTSPSL